MAVSSLSFRTYISNLSGRKLGAFKRAAAKIGISLNEYIDRLERGQKHCIDCRQWKDRGEFHPDKTRWDGTSAKCKACSSMRGIESHSPVDPSALKICGPERESPRGGDKIHARHLINLDVAKNRRPNPNDLYCAKCGHKGDDKRHEYHHHMGYSAEHAYDVVALCSICHSEEDQNHIDRERSADGTFTKKGG